MKTWFANLKFRYKLLICMTFITTLALFFISQLSYYYFYNRNRNEVLSKAEDSVQMASSTLDGQFNFLAVSTNHLLVKEPFPQMVTDISNGCFDGYSTYFSEGSQQIDSFLQNQDMVSNVLFCGEQDFVFNRTTLGNSSQIRQLFPEDIWSIDRITVLPTRYNSLSFQGNTIPIIYPVSYNPGERSFRFQDKEGSVQKARFIVLLDAGKINSYFRRMSNSYTDSMYLSDAYGHPLDFTYAKDIPAYFPSVVEWVSDVTSFDSNQIKTDDDILYLTAQPIKFCNLKLVHITSQSAWMGDIRELKNFFLGVWMVSTVVAGVLALAISSLLTRQLKQLGGIIGQIDDDRYQTKIVFPHRDEISLLGNQLNQMYDTIQLQLTQIKEEEQKKARAEIQMMSEQMNPHFLYNTLECIHFQVLNGNERTAGAMLESLGRYLRITLSMGKSIITLEKEVEHVTSYMEIMNRHSPSGIRFHCHMDPGLKNQMVPKSLLQPLVENCIKHGFGGCVGNMDSVPPQISIYISQDREYQLKIEVTDNGKGIDLQKAEQCISKEPEGNRNFGLYNIHKRIRAYYGTCTEITFLSIPYLKNSVCIKIPNVMNF